MTRAVWRSLIVAALFRRAMVEQEPPAGLDPIDQGIRLFNEEYFFEAHEVLEDLWKKEHGKSKMFLQGLIQICAAYHHFQNGNLIGAETLLDRGAQKMRSYPADYLGIDTARSTLPDLNGRPQYLVEDQAGPLRELV